MKIEKAPDTGSITQDLAQRCADALSALMPAGVLWHLVLTNELGCAALGTAKPADLTRAYRACFAVPPGGRDESN